jgi:hypothetical protein
MMSRVEEQRFEEMVTYVLLFVNDALVIDTWEQHICFSMYST